MKFLAALAVVFISCTTTPEAVPSMVALDFLDSATFDSRLSKALDSGAKIVTVRFLSEATTNELPPRVDRWLYAVSERYGNAVALKPEEGTTIDRNLAVVALVLGKQAYELLRTELTYRPARSYDATLYYIPQTGALTRVAFTNRGARGLEEEKADAN